MRFAFIAIPLLAGAVSGCVAITSQEIRAADEATCRGYGFKPGTNAFAECLQRIDLARAADRRAWLYGDRSIGIGSFYRGRYGPYW